MTTREKLNAILQALLNNPIVEETDVDGWHIRKYANGWAELLKQTYYANVAISTAWNNIYTAKVSETLPFTLTGAIDTPSIRTNHVVSVTNVVVTANTVITDIACTQNRTGYVYVNHRITGRWK